MDIKSGAVGLVFIVAWFVARSRGLVGPNHPAWRYALVCAIWGAALFIALTLVAQDFTLLFWAGVVWGVVGALVGAFLGLLIASVDSEVRRANSLKRRERHQETRT